MIRSIHGAFGGRLVDAQGEERWPGNLNRLLWADYRDLALTINTQTLQPEPSALRVSGITEEVAGQDFYGRIRDVLEQVGRYREQQAGVPPTGAGRHYYVFEYDWRQDNVVSARKLHRFLDRSQSPRRLPMQYSQPLACVCENCPCARRIFWLPQRRWKAQNHRPPRPAAISRKRALPERRAPLGGGASAAACADAQPIKQAG